MEPITKKWAPLSPSKLRSKKKEDGKQVNSKKEANANVAYFYF